MHCFGECFLPLEGPSTFEDAGATQLRKRKRGLKKNLIILIQSAVLSTLQDFEYPSSVRKQVSIFTLQALSLRSLSLARERRRTSPLPRNSDLGIGWDVARFPASASREETMRRVPEQRLFWSLCPAREWTFDAFAPPLLLLQLVVQGEFGDVTAVLNGNSTSYSPIFIIEFTLIREQSPPLCGGDEIPCTKSDNFQ